MSDEKQQTEKRQRTTSFATGVAEGKRLTKSKTYTVAEVADLCDVSTHAVSRWINLGYVKSIKEPVEGTKRHVHHITGEALAEFFAARKDHLKGVAQRRAEREKRAKEVAAEKAAKAEASA